VAIQHVTINTLAQEQLAMRKGDSSLLIPNVLNFEQPPPEPDEYASQLRSDLGLSPDDILFLQPTRVVPRKGIEHSISLIARLKDPRCKLIVSHESGDEGDDYLRDLKELAEQEGVDLRFVHTSVSETRSVDPEGRRRFTLADAYCQADFITYPSIYEGFGNALLEAFYYRKPVLVNRYSIFISDIEPKGFRTISMDGYLTRDVVQHVRRVIHEPEYREEMVHQNYELSKAFFSYTVLRRRLRVLITNITGMEDL
jgi:glycosyltransferase involved in cell wall biosynthesis